MYKKIFVPVDDSRESMRALREACEFAKLLKADIHMVHVVDLSQFGWGGSSFMQSKEVQNVTSEIGGKIIEKAKAVCEEFGVPYNYQILESTGGNVVQVLSQSVKSNNCDLVVMGTHGFSGVMHLLMGSVAEGLLREVDVPIMFLRKHVE